MTIWIWAFFACFAVRDTALGASLTQLSAPDSGTSFLATLTISLIGVGAAVGSAVLAANVTSRHARADAQTQITNAIQIADADRRAAETRFASEIRQSRLMARQQGLNDSISALFSTLDNIRRKDFKVEEPAYLNEEWIYSCHRVHLYFDSNSAVNRSEYVRALFGGIISQFSRFSKQLIPILEGIDRIRDQSDTTRATRFMLVNGQTVNWPETEGFEWEAAVEFRRAVDSIIRTYTRIAREWPDEKAAYDELDWLATVLVDVQNSYTESQSRIELMSRSLGLVT